MMENQIQGTEEWFKAKRGKVSASHIADILMKPTAAGYRNYLAKLVLERLTDKTEETFCSFDMQRGIDLEPDARISYGFISGNTVEQAMWVNHPFIEFAGCSPDGIIKEDDNIVGLVEFKCPKAANHLDYILTEKIDRNYILQMQDQMLCTGASWCDFVSYHPDFPLEMQLKIIRVDRDEKKIKEIEDATISFLTAIDDMLSEINSRGASK